MKLFFILLVLPILGISSAPGSKCRDRAGDLIIALEQSQVITSETFTKMKEAAKKVVKRISIGVDNGQFRVQIVIYGKEIERIGYWLDSRQVDDQIDDLFDEIKYKAVKGLPCISHCIVSMMQELDASRRGEGYKGIIALFTSGENSEKFESLKKTFSSMAERHKYYSIYSMYVTHNPPRSSAMNNIKRISHEEPQPLSNDNDILFWLQKRISKRCHECYQPKLDVSILIEDMEPKIFSAAKKFVVNYVKKFRNNTKVSVVFYGDKLYKSKSFGFDNKYSRQELKNAINALPVMHSTQEIKDVPSAVDHAVELFSNSHRNVSKVILLMSRSLGGKPSEAMKESFKKARDMNIHFLVMPFAGTYLAKEYNDFLNTRTTAQHIIGWGILRNEINFKYQPSILADYTCFYGHVIDKH